MAIWRRLQSWLSWFPWYRRQAREADLQRELRDHLELEAEEHRAAGLSPAEAAYAAHRALGNTLKIEEDVRTTWGFQWLETCVQDVRYGFRTLRKSPGFTAIAVLTLALGIGANTAVFSVVNAVLLKPLSYPDPDRIVTLTNPLKAGEAPTALNAQLVSIPDFQDWHDQSSSFEAMAYYASRETVVMPGSAAEYARATRVSPEFFRVFAVEPVVGRLFTPEELKLNSGGAVVISYVYWQSHFGGDPRVLGQTVRGLGRALPIVGVLPPGFRFPDKTDLWYPVNTVFREPTAQSRAGHSYFAVGRLRPGVSLERAQTEMTSIARRLEQQYPESDKGRTVAVTRMRDEMVGDVRLTLYLLLGAVAVVLLIACANTATLLLGKATARTREVAVRVALGASRQRIVRQLITESLLLALLAGGVGLLLAYGGSKALVALAPANLPRLGEIGIDQSVLAFTLVVSMITSLLFGLVPGLYASKVGVNDTLKQGAARGMIGGGMVRMRGVLVAAEIALAVVLLSGAGLLMKSFVALHNVALGFRAENVLVMKTTVPAPLPVARQFFQDLLPQISALPGVLSAGATMVPPGHVESMGPYFFDRLPPQRDWISAPSAVISIVTPGTFAALGIPLKSGRDFNDADASDKPFVAVVNEALVRKSLPGGNPIGRTVFCLYDNAEPMTIIGVAGDVRERGPAHDPIPECYIPYRQHDFVGTLNVVTRTAGDPTALEATIQCLVRERSPDVAMKFTTMETDASENVATPRFRTLLLGVFAGLAVLLAMAGVYGVMAYAVSQRTNEIGVRIALGASTGSLFRLVLGRGLVIAGLGLALGLTAAAAGTRLLTTMLFQVHPNDPLVYLAVAVLLGVVALLACYIPARRAMRVDPMIALRYE